MVQTAQKIKWKTLIITLTVHGLVVPVCAVIPSGPLRARRNPHDFSEYEKLALIVI